MGRTLQVVSGHVTTGGAGVFSALAANTGDSFVVANFEPSAKASLVDMWGTGAVATQLRLRSPRLHDQAQGIRLNLPLGAPQISLPPFNQPLYPGDALTFEVADTSAGELDVAGLLIEYDDLPGAAPRYESEAGIVSRIVNIIGVEVDVAASATAGDWSAGRAMNADFDNLKAGIDYALLGFVGPLQQAAIAVAGPDTSNFKQGGMLRGVPIDDGQYFITRDRQLGRPSIPVINSNNKGNTLVYCASVANAGIKVSLILAQLG